MAQQEQQPIRIRDALEFELLNSRRIFLGDGIDQHLAEDIILKLLYLESKDPGKPITLLINSPGGSVDAGFAIWDQVKLITSPVTTVVTGLAASMGSVLSLVAGKGKRFATENARIMIHQPLIGGVIRGQASDLEIHAEEILKTRKRLVQLYSEATGKPEEEIDRAVDRDSWFSAQEAMEFGLIDNIVKNYSF